MENPKKSGINKPLVYTGILIGISLAIYIACSSTDSSVIHAPAVDTVSAVDSAAEEANAQKQEQAELTAEIQKLDKRNSIDV